MKVLHVIAWILLIVGGLNWGLDAWGWNLVEAIFGGAATWIYYLVALAAVYELFAHGKNCRACKPGV